MKILNLIFFTATVATVLLSLSSSGKVDAFGGDCWKNIRSWFSTSCNSNRDCPSNSRCVSRTCQAISTEFIDLCKTSCLQGQLCIKRSTNSVECKSFREVCRITYDGWLNFFPRYVCETSNDYYYW